MLLFINEGIEPRYLSFILIILLIAQVSKNKRIGKAFYLLIGGWLLLITVLIISNSEQILRLYPVAVNLALLTVFGLSIKYPPTVVERLARIKEPELPAVAVGYCTNVTKVWCVFFIFNISASTVTLFLSTKAWAFYNGFISYIIMGLIFALEYIIRIRYKKTYAQKT